MGISGNLQNCGLMGHLRNVIQHQVHTANGALQAKAPARAGQHWQAPNDQEKASGPAGESGLHRSIRCWKARSRSSSRGGGDGSGGGCCGARPAVRCGTRLGSPGEAPLLGGNSASDQSRSREITLQGGGHPPPLGGAGLGRREASPCKGHFRKQTPSIRAA